MNKSIIRALTIAGSDASGGAGMAADINTFEEYGIFGQVALTTVVSMDKHSWDHLVYALPESLIKQQLDTIFASTVPISALKTGMLGTPSVVNLVKETIKEHTIPAVVIDPVLVCKGTDEVLNPDTAHAIETHLLPLATVVTPNLFEAGVLSGCGKLSNIEEMKMAAEIIHKKGAKHVVVKGGKSLQGDLAIDVFYDGSAFHVLESKKTSVANNHGAGCTFAAAITAGLAKGLSPIQSVDLAKQYVTAAIKHGFTYNQFVGPVFRPAYRTIEQQSFDDK